MNIVTAQLTPLMPILSENPITKPEFVKRAQETSVRKGIINLLELIDFQHAFTNGKEIVLAIKPHFYLGNYHSESATGIVRHEIQIQCAIYYHVKNIGKMC